MIKILILVVFYLFFPLVIIWLCKKWSLFKKLGSIVIAYGFGLVLGNTGILPSGSSDYLMLQQGRPSIPTDEITVLYEEGRLGEDDLLVFGQAHFLGKRRAVDPPQHHSCQSL